MASPVNDSYNVGSGGSIYGGRNSAQLINTINSMATGEWLEYTSTNLTEYENTGPDSLDMSVLESAANKPLTNWTNKYGWSSDAKTIVAVGTAEGYISESPAGAHSKMIRFDADSNSWSVEWNPVGVSSGHGYDGNTSVEINGYFYRKSFGDLTVSKYHTATDTWSTGFSLSSVNSPTIPNVVMIEAHPNLGASGSVVCVVNDGRLLRYDIDTDTASTVGTYTGIDDYSMCVYIPGLDSVIFGGGETGTKLHKVDNTGAVTEVTGSLPEYIHCGSAADCFLAHPSSQNAAFLLSDDDDHLHKYDIDTDSWTDLGLIPTELQGRVFITAGISIHGHGALVFLHGKGRVSGENTSEMWVYKV